MEVLEKIINNPVKLWATVILAISEISALIFLISAWIRDSKQAKKENSQNG